MEKVVRVHIGGFEIAITHKSALYSNRQQFISLAKSYFNRPPYDVKKMEKHFDLVAKRYSEKR